MNENTNRETFRIALREAYRNFDGVAEPLSIEYARDNASGKKMATSLDDLLERPTRRYLIDPILRGLNWDPDDANALIEEARARDAGGARLFLDYLGISLRERKPVLIVEAKRYTVPGPRRPNKPAAGSTEAAELISTALALRKEEKSVDRAILAEWAEWLDEVRSYVNSFDALGKSTLRRVVISSGQWLIVFKDPIGAFVDSGAPKVGDIYCFLSAKEIVANYHLIYDLLYRQRLINPLAPAISADEALQVLSSGAIDQYFRGVAVSTDMAGAARGRIPARIVYPALLVKTGNRIFSVVNYAMRLQEPVDQGQFADFHGDLNIQAQAFEAGFLRLLGRADLTPQPLTSFPGFPKSQPERSMLDPIPPEPDSTVDFAETEAAERIAFVSAVQDEAGAPMYVVVTGTEWFYKVSPAREPTCIFHRWREAKVQGVGSVTSVTVQGKASMTMDEEVHHCAHEQLRIRRGARCHVEVLESHLCCRSCAFYDGCWEVDAGVLPCTPGVQAPGPARS